MLLGAFASITRGLLESHERLRESIESMKPPTGGPTTGPRSAGTVSQAMAATSSAASRARREAARPWLG